MKTLGMAFGMSLAASLIFYAILSLTGIGETALHVAGLPLIGVPHLYEVLEKRQAKRALPESTDKIYTLEGFAIPWQLMAVYGTFIFFGIAQAVSAVAGVLSALSDTPRGATDVLKAVQMPLIVLASYLLGFWIGSRSAAKGLLAIVMAVLLGRILTVTVDFVVMSPADFEAIMGYPKTQGTFLWSVLVGFVIGVVPGMLGYWRGTRAKLSKYLRYLLDVLPPATRATIVALAYEEAARTPK